MSDLRSALSSALGIKVEPKQEQKKWTVGTLPIPTKCRYCNSDVEFVNNSTIYGTSYGTWPYAYKCSSCDAYVGVHKNTKMPMGTLADYKTREARKAAKESFNPIWQDKYMTRTQAYQWLAGQLDIEDATQCHIGWMDVDQCKQVEKVCDVKLLELDPDVYDNK